MLRKLELHSTRKTLSLDDVSEDITIKSVREKNNLEFALTSLRVNKTSDYIIEGYNDKLLFEYNIGGGDITLLITFSAGISTIGDIVNAFNTAFAATLTGFNASAVGNKINISTDPLNPNHSIKFLTPSGPNIKILQRCYYVLGFSGENINQVYKNSDPNYRTFKANYPVGSIIDQVYFVGDINKISSYINNESSTSIIKNIELPIDQTFVHFENASPTNDNFMPIENNNNTYKFTFINNDGDVLPISVITYWSAEFIIRERKTRTRISPQTEGPFGPSVRSVPSQRASEVILY